MLPNTTFRRTALKLIGLGTVGSFFATRPSTAQNKSNPGRLFTFNDLAGNQGPLVGDDGDIRGIDAGGLPWVLENGQAKLHSNGRLQVNVKGLVLDPEDDRVPDGVKGTNPIPTFKAILSCITITDSGNRETVNVSTEPVSVDEDGDAKIREIIDVPEPCYAPIVFVTSGGGSWFASTGFR